MNKEPRIVLYRDSANAWRWRYISANGRVLADSGQGYTDKRNAVAGLEAVTGGVYEVTYFHGRGQYQQGRLCRATGDVFVEVLG